MNTFFITLAVLVLFILTICIYFWPYFIATKKQEDEHLAIFIVNLFVAWTVVGWFICLMWAISLHDYRTKEQIEADKNAKNAIWAFIKKNWIVFSVIIVLISAIVAFADNTSQNKQSANNTDNEAINRYKQQTNNFTMCELGDFLGDDVDKIEYKNYNLEYYPSDYSKNQVKKFADECSKLGANSQYQMDCCVRFKMYPY